MESSESLELIAAAVVAFQGEVTDVAQDGFNPHFKSRFATLSNVWATIRPLLAKHGLALLQFPTSDGQLVSMLVHTSGQFLRTTVSLMPKEKSPQGIASAITYMRRYAAMAILGIAPAGEDDDGEAATRPETISMPVNATLQGRKQ